MKAIGFGVCVCLSISFNQCFGYGLWHAADQNAKLSDSSLLLPRNAFYPLAASVTPDVVINNNPSVNLKDIPVGNEFIAADDINDFNNEVVTFRVPYTKLKKSPEIILVSNTLAYSVQERAFINDTAPYYDQPDPVSSISFQAGSDITPELPGLIILHSTSGESSELRPFRPEVFSWAGHEEQIIIFHDESGPKLKPIATKKLYGEYGDVASIKLIWNSGSASFQCLLRPGSPTACLDEDDIVDPLIALFMLAAGENGMVSRYLMTNGEVRYVISRNGTNRYTLSYKQLRLLLAIYDEFQQTKIYPELFSLIPWEGWVAPENWRTEHRIIPFTTLRLLARLIGQERLKLSFNSGVGRQTPKTKVKVIKKNTTTQRERVVRRTGEKIEIGKKVETTKVVKNFTPRSVDKHDAKKAAASKNKGELEELEELEEIFETYCKLLKNIKANKKVFEKDLSFFTASAFGISTLLTYFARTGLFEERSKISDELESSEYDIKKEVQLSFPEVFSFLLSLIQRYQRYLEVIDSVIKAHETDRPIFLRHSCHITHLFSNLSLNSVLLVSDRYTEYDGQRVPLRANALSVQALMLKLLFQSSETLQLLFEEEEYIGGGIPEFALIKDIAKNLVYSTSEIKKFIKNLLAIEFVCNWKSLAGPRVSCSSFLSDQQLKNVLTAFFILLEHRKDVPPLQADDFLQEQSSAAGNRLMKLVMDTPDLMDKLCQALLRVLQIEKNIISGMAPDKQSVSSESKYLFTWLPVLRNINSHIQDDEKEKTSGFIIEIERFEQTIQQITEQQKAQALKHSDELIQQEENKKALLVNQERLQKQRRAIKQYYREILHSKDDDNPDTTGSEVTTESPLSIWEQSMDDVASLITNENYQEAIEQLEIIIIGSTDSIEIFISRSEQVFILAAYIDRLALPLRECHRQQRLFEQVVDNIDMVLLEQTLLDNDFQGIKEALALLEKHSINIFSREDREKYFECAAGVFEDPDHNLFTITQLYQQLTTHVEALEPVLASAIASNESGRSTLKQVDINMVSRVGFVREAIQSVIFNMEWIKKRFEEINNTLSKVKLINKRLGIYGSNIPNPTEKSKETLLQVRCKEFARELPAKYNALQSIKKYLPDSSGTIGAGDTGG